MSRMRNAVVAAAVATIAVAGCAAGVSPAPDLGDLYNRAAQAEDATRNPVIVILGIGGSKLQDRDTGRVVWGAFAGTYANPSQPDGARLVALPMAQGRPLRDLRDAVEATGALDRIRVRLFSDHLALTQDLGFADNLLFRLLDSPRPAAPGHAARTQP
jgi:hypothetical protein